jgi:anti-anti-sigma factor
MNNNELVPGFDDKKDDSLRISLEKVDDVQDAIIVLLNGYIDTYNSAYFQHQIEKIVSEGFINIIFNCTNLNYVSSTGIGSFSVFLKLIKPKGGNIILQGVQPKVHEVFQLLGFSQVFEMKETLDDAIARFSKKRSAHTSIAFPKVLGCPACGKKLRATKPGRFRCSDCKSIIVIDEEAHAYLG